MTTPGFATNLADIDSRFAQAQTMLDAAKRLDPSTVRRTSAARTELFKLQKATFFVLTYNALEFSVRITLQSTFEEIARSSEPSSNLKPGITGVALHKTWWDLLGTPHGEYGMGSLRLRREIATEIRNTLLVSRTSEIVVNRLINGNIKTGFLIDIGKHVFDLPLARIFPIGRAISSIQTVTEKRQLVAHGDLLETPLRVGGEYSVDELEDMFSHVRDFSVNFHHLFEGYCNSKEYLV